MIDIDRLHEENVVIDGHLDLANIVQRERGRGRTRVIEQDFIDDFKAAGLNVVISSLYIDGKDLGNATEEAKDQIRKLKEDIRECRDLVELCVSYTEIIETVESGKIAILLSFEGAEPIKDDINLLREFYALGVRGLGLCWSRKNAVADGCRYVKGAYEGEGLSEFGVEVIKEAEKLGMFIDISHTSDRGVRELMEIVTKPVIASHSNTRELWNVARNIPKEQILQVAKTGGTIGVNAAGVVVASKKEDATVSKLADHIQNVINLVGVDHIAIGLDLCDKLDENDRTETIMFEGEEVQAYDVLNTHKELKLLTKELIDRGMSEEDLKKFLGTNLLRVFKEILD